MITVSKIKKLTKEFKKANPTLEYLYPLPTTVVEIHTGKTISEEDFKKIEKQFENEPNLCAVYAGLEAEGSDKIASVFIEFYEG